jgi:ABC-type branched-subunit amino acid transport system substrate-binding protein
MAKNWGYDLIARKMLNELEKEYPGMDYVVSTKEVSVSVPIPKKSKYLIGIVLPLSGIHKPFGEKALEGIRLALKEKESREKPPLISLMIRDSKGSPLEVEKAVEELAKAEKAIAIIGPLLSSTVDRASKKAQQLKVPLLSLSQKEPAFGKGEFVFQNSLTPLEQVQRLVDFAVKELELRTFAVFYPNSPYGFHFKNLFNQEVARMGGKVLGTVVYQEEQTDFRQEVKGFFKVEAIQKQEGTKRKEEEFKQGLSVDGLFIPDTHDRVGTILSQMAYFDIKGATFLGTNAWNGPGLITIAGKGAEGAIFVDAFSKVPSVKNFIDEFQKEYLRQPETLEAICYDGARFLREILQSKSPSTPSELKEELRKFHPFQGVSGLKGFREDGKAIRTLSILRVKNGQIEHFSP